MDRECLLDNERLRMQQLTYDKYRYRSADHLATNVLCQFYITPPSQKNLLIQDKAHGPLSKRPLCLAGRHNDWCRRIIWRSKARGSREELPPPQQTRHEVQWSNASDERRPGDLCTYQRMTGSFE